MGKKIFAILLLSAVVAGNVFAQEGEGGNLRIAVSMGMISGEVSYEQVLSPYFSVLGQVSYSNFIISDSLSVSAKGRWYPFGGAFFLEMGFGYSNGYNISSESAQAAADVTLTLITLGMWILSEEFKGHTYDETGRNNGFLLQPGLGWNIDIGQKEGFLLPISMGADIRLAERTTFLPFLKFGLGFSF